MMDESREEVADLQNEIEKNEEVTLEKSVTVLVEEANTEGRSKRERKQVEHFKAEFVPIRASKDLEYSGSGTELGEIDLFVENISKIKEDDEVIKSLYGLIFGAVGSKGSRKKSLRKFSGFGSDSIAEDKKSKLIENKKKWTVTILKEALDLFGLQKTGSREELCERLVDYLASPVDNNKQSTPAKRKSVGKSPKSSGKRKRNSRGKSKSPKVKRAPSAYILFCNATRPAILEAEPDLLLGEVSKRLGAQWGELGPSEKEEWEEKAREAKKEFGQAVLEDQDGGDEDEEAGDEEEEEEEAVVAPPKKKRGPKKRVSKSADDEDDEAEAEKEKETEIAPKKDSGRKKRQSKASKVVEEEVIEEEVEDAKEADEEEDAKADEMDLAVAADEGSEANKEPGAEDHIEYKSAEEEVKGGVSETVVDSNGGHEEGDGDGEGVGSAVAADS